MPVAGCQMDVISIEIQLGSYPEKIAEALRKIITLIAVVSCNVQQKAPAAGEVVRSLRRL